MKKALVIAITLLVGTLLGAVLMGTVLAAPPAPQATPTAPVPGTGRGFMERGGMMGGRVGGGWMGGGIGFEDEVLALLNMTREQIVAERQAGKSLVQIAQSKNVTEQTLISTILAAKRADLDKLVADGKLTQAQADQMYQNMQQQVPLAVSSTTVGPRMGNGSMPHDPAVCPMLGNGQPNGTQPGQNTRPNMPGRGGMRGGGWNGPTT